MEKQSVAVIRLEENGGKQVQSLYEEAPVLRWQGMANWPANKTDA